MSAPETLKAKANHYARIAALAHQWVEIHMFGLGVYHEDIANIIAWQQQRRMASGLAIRYRFAYLEYIAYVA